MLADAYPILQAVEPAELATVLGELADSGRGLGDEIGRSLDNAGVLADLTASNDAEIRRLTGDLASLAEELDRLAPAAVTGARDLNAALPTLTARRGQLEGALQDVSGLAADVADLLEANTGFTRNLLEGGSDTLQVVFDRRQQLQPLLLGVQQYAQSFAEAIRFDLRDGSRMAAIKNVVSVEEAVAGANPPPGEADDPPESVLDAVPLPEVPDVVEDVGGVVDDVLGITDPLLDLLLGRGRR